MSCKNYLIEGNSEKVEEIKFFDVVLMKIFLFRFLWDGQKIHFWLLK